MGLMDDAREELKRRIEATQPDERVASVRNLSQAAGNLSTASTVAVLQEAIDEGWIYSTRGPNGGYWRTEKKVDVGLKEALVELISSLSAATAAALTVREILDKKP